MTDDAAGSTRDGPTAGLGGVADAMADADQQAIDEIAAAQSHGVS